MTRFKASPTTPEGREEEEGDGAVPILPLVRDFYAQRASTPGTLLITEGVVIAKKAGVFLSAPGIWSEEQIVAWREVRFWFCLS
jgi:2,4-dienoyl-CoA reductase-like NADH-dependent reductase (Old Yellow Enzyme family)